MRDYLLCLLQILILCVSLSRRDSSPLSMRIRVRVLHVYEKCVVGRALPNLDPTAARLRITQQLNVTVGYQEISD